MSNAAASMIATNDLSRFIPIILSLLLFFHFLRDSYFILDFFFHDKIIFLLCLNIFLFLPWFLFNSLVIILVTSTKL